jgi:hypothetical protein
MKYSHNWYTSGIDYPVSEKRKIAVVLKLSVQIAENPKISLK